MSESVLELRESGAIVYDQKYFLNNNIDNVWLQEEEQQQEKLTKQPSYNNDELHTIYGWYKISRAPTQRNEIKKCTWRNVNVKKSMIEGIKRANYQNKMDRIQNEMYRPNLSQPSKEHLESYLKNWNNWWKKLINDVFFFI